MNRLKEASDGVRAKQLLENPIYIDAVSKVRQGIIEAWSKSPVRDTEGQATLRLMLKLLDDIEKNIRTVADTGKLAALEIEQEKERESRMRKILRFGR